jgi:hypothetical protein
LILHLRRGCAWLRRIGEETGPVELNVLEEPGQLIDMLFGLPGETDDERGPKRGFRVQVPDPMRALCFSVLPGRFIFLRRAPETCCKERSKYGATTGLDVISSRSLSLISRGWR